MSHLPVDPGYDNILPTVDFDSRKTSRSKKRSHSGKDFETMAKRSNSSNLSSPSALPLQPAFNLHQYEPWHGRSQCMPLEGSHNRMTPHYRDAPRPQTHHCPPAAEAPLPYTAYDQDWDPSPPVVYTSDAADFPPRHTSELCYQTRIKMEGSAIPLNQDWLFNQRPPIPGAYPKESYGTKLHPLEISSSPELGPQVAPAPPSVNIYDTYKAPDNAPPIPVFGSKPDDPSADVVPVTEPVLCKEQAELVELILSRRNVFYTGSAGCGKSTVLKSFVRRFTEMGLKVNIVAPTGRAALDINGSTTWTYAGWTPDSHKKPLKELKKNAHGKFVSQRLKDTDVLVIDEISMVENLHFERLNVIMKEARGSDLAFGGVQLVVTGDFCQLPPVKPFGHCIECGRELIKNKEETEYRCRMHGTYYDIDKWAFRSSAWKECNFAHVNLTNIHRQSDEVFIKILQKLRMGKRLLPADTELLLNHKDTTRNAVQLFSTRGEVKRVNDDMFAKLRSKSRTYQCLDHFKWNEKHRHLESKRITAADGSLAALREHRYEPQIQLKKGMLVVLLHNLDIASGLVNGSQGTIQGFEDYDANKLPKAASSRNGRDADPNGPTIVGDYATFREEQLKAFITKAELKQWPIVRFLNGVERTIFADCTVNELGDEPPYSLLARTQIPLMAAWAMTTHKSQGMTLNRVIVDLAKAFEEGQAYVALSRARSLDGLKVVSLPPLSKMGSGNPQVKEFLREKFNIE